MKQLLLKVLCLTGCLTLITLTVMCGGKKRTAPPVATSPSPAVTPPPPSSPEMVLNVYLENSGSMDGYVNGNTEFKQSVYSYLSDIKISGITKEINLFYINSVIIKYGSDISDFIEKLNPATFKIRGGNRSTSDISNILETILKETKENGISVFVSDCVFSPGKSKDANQYLINQQIGIKSNVATHLKTNNLAIVIYQFSSLFDGKYYDKNNSSTQINEQRPYYIWLVGNPQYITALREKVPDTKFKVSDIQHLFSIVKGNREVGYAVKVGSGQFDLDKKNPKTAILNWKTDSKGKGAGVARFSVNVNLSGFLLDDAYLCDPSNYELSDKDFTLSVTKAVSNSFGYTHSLNITSSHVKKTSLSIKLLNKMPQWVNEVNDSIGAAPLPGKIYGIKYLFNGIYDAFTFDNNLYTEIKIQIN
ncbi:MAG: hypothetical protein LBR10_13155 [Prevotellaceae bacterium]|jgi:hypothetical protein|nr:hypothetical protein [Prevotellaceae bacterium]